MQYLRTPLLVFVFILIVLLQSLSTHPVLARQLPRLAFESIVDGNRDIYIWDRAKIIRVTQSPDQEFNPMWSTDGKLAYFSVDKNSSASVTNLNSSPTLYVWDGSTTIKLGVMSSILNSLPSWSPDGRLAFTMPGNERNRVYVWDGKTTIDVLPDAKATDSPRWNTDGRLAFEVAASSSNTEVYIWDGKTAVNISNHPAQDYDPVWGPDGKVAFTSYRDGKTREIYVWDGKSLSNISQSPRDDYGSELSWNSKGQIVYTRNSETSSLNDVIVWNGSKLIEVIKGIAPEFPPQWTPDNSLLLVYQTEQGFPRTEIWNGKQLTTLTSYPVVTTVVNETFYSPVWSPDGRLAMILILPAGESDMGPMFDSVVHVWHKSGLTAIRQDRSINPEYVVWSADNMLAWQASMINGDAVGGSYIYVWDGENIRRVSAAENSLADQNPVWEPIGN